MTVGWQTKKLGELLDIQNGYAFNSKAFSVEGEMPLIRIRDLKAGVDTETRYTGDYDQKYLVKAGDLLIGMDGEFGCYEWKGNHALLNQRVCRLQSFNNVLLPRFLFYGINSYLKDIENVTGFTTVKHISSKQIVGIKFPTPPIQEQQRIVTILDEAFAGIATATANAEKNRDYARELFDSYWHGIIANPKYEIRVLDELCSSFEYGTSSKSKSAGNVPVLRMGNIQDGRFDWSSLAYSNDDDEIKKYSLKHNDVLFNRTNSPELVGKTAIYKGEMPAIFAGYLIRINRNETLLDADYLTHFLNSSVAKAYGKTVVISSVNQANINATKLKSYPIPSPSLSEQQAIVAKLNELSTETKKLETIYQQKLIALNELKKSILNQAFSGQLQ